MARADSESGSDAGAEPNLNRTVPRPVTVPARLRLVTGTRPELRVTSHWHESRPAGGEYRDSDSMMVSRARRPGSPARAGRTGPRRLKGVRRRCRISESRQRPGPVESSRAGRARRLGRPESV